MSTPKKFPPFKVDCDGSDSWIIDRTGAVVVDTVRLSAHYSDAYPDGEIMRIICGALNREEDA